MNRTLMYGEGLFETILWQGRTRKLYRHYERLRSSAEFFSLECPDFETFCRNIEQRTNGKKDIYVKVCLFSYGRHRYYEKSSRTSLVVYAYKHRKVSEPKSLCFSDIRRSSSDPLLRHKTTNYFLNVLVKRKALMEGFYDCIFLNEKDEITECTSANMILLFRNRLLTPYREGGLLFGTSLQALMEKVDIREERLRKDDIVKASSVFLMNSLIGVLPIYRVEDKVFNVDAEVLNHLRKVLWEDNSS
ncbi:MAG: aminotransferase class IV [Aquificaceae bacterium]